MQSDNFSCYLKWENNWIIKQKEKYKNELRRIGDTIALCRKRFQSPIQNLRIILTPIKCVYSADHHIQDNKFIYCSGSLSEESIIHEFLHHIVYPIVHDRKDEILCCDFTNLDIDTSYYLNNDELGILNAFEENAVRLLTDAMVSGDVPETLDVFLDQEISKRHKLN